MVAAVLYRITWDWEYLTSTDSLKALLRVHFVDVDDPRRASQEQTYVFFGDYLDECEGLCGRKLLIAIYSSL